MHLVDMDPQASLTSAFGFQDEEGLLFQALKDRAELPVVGLSEALSLTPSSIDLARAESDFLAEAAREYILEASVEATTLPDETLVILDCPPSLSLLAVNCLAAADKLLVVVHPGGFELRALVHLQDTVRVLKERVNPQLELVGAVLTRCDMRKKSTEIVQQEVERVYDLLGRVRGDAQLQYACSDGMMLYLQQSHALEEYAGVAEKLKKKSMEKGRLAGITGLLGSITGEGNASGTKPLRVERQSKSRERLAEPDRSAMAGPAPEPADQSARVKRKTPARLGRPPGRKSGESSRKRKTTLWVSAELMDAYTDWSWDERCNLGESVERALRDYWRRRKVTRTSISN